MWSVSARSPLCTVYIYIVSFVSPTFSSHFLSLSRSSSSPLSISLSLSKDQEIRNLKLQIMLRIASLIIGILVLFLSISVSQSNRESEILSPSDHLSSSNGSSEKERTLAIIKPDGLTGNYTDRIKTVILESGFNILKEIIVQLDEDRVASFYAEHSSRSFFSSLLLYMTSGPVLVMALEKEHAIADWRSLIGPTDARKAKITHPHSIRALCGLDLEKNCVHGSDSPQSADREISFFFNDLSSGGVVIEHDEL